MNSNAEGISYVILLNIAVFLLFGCFMLMAAILDFVAPVLIPALIVFGFYKLIKHNNKEVQNETKIQHK